ncbi:MAG: 4Fe-4S dicluster domain-containing protein [Syntrophales bacterium]|jgi:ferredoxin|nr:4Fe-4S dicluster domain-containing protein [Syntrophales bacterium]MCK9527551.1 4Fe-4S dicluster domain-containing protein [Syntrophales bacterium]MDX9922608.1 4Fe-4S dicluster domain-containing protein [Syntrophales bacterium]
MTDAKTIEKRLKEEAIRLLGSGAVSAVLAWTAGYDEKHPMPFAARSLDEVDDLVFNEYCTANMARYIGDWPAGTKLAVAVKGVDSRAVVVLIQEEKACREDLVLLGIPFRGLRNHKTGDIIDERTTAATANPVLFDILLGDEITEEPGSPYDVLAELEAMGNDDRWSFWKKELDKCIRCYACRKACPMCYCDPCFVDLTRPRWADKSPNSAGNLMYHLTRFYHLAGRCVDCGECSRACPVDIPLYLFHKKVAKECEEMFNQTAGMNIDDKPVMVDFRVEDSDSLLE